ncbi:MAG: acyl-CoA carboxylase subunit beta [Candidatus Polarisedimenticolia bacterium]
MAKVMMEPIGTPLRAALDEASASANTRAMAALNAALDRRRQDSRAGWGPEYERRVREKGRLTTWDRIDRLRDSGTPVLPVGSLVNDGLTFGEKKQTSPAAGVVTAYIRVAGRLAVVIANDNTVASGSWWPMTPEKIQRAQEMALRLRAPVIYLVDCSGLFLPEQGRTFPGRAGAGAIFKMNALLSDAGVPQIAGVLGDCIAGGGYMPIISDVVYMTEQAYMVIAGAALVKGGKGQTITSLDIGGPDVHVHLSACADHRVPDDEACLAGIRAEMGRLSGSAAPYYRRGADHEPPRFPPEEIDAFFPGDHRMAYDVRQLIARLVDSSLFWEVLPGTGREMICGVARFGGLYAGVIANNQLLTEHPDQEHARRPGGILYREGIAKVSAFSRACNDDGLPIVWLQDISGFDIGPEAEKQGLLGYGSSLIYTNATNTTPMITVLLRKASGAGYYALAGLPYAPVLQLATPLTRLAVMEGRTLAIGAYRTKLDESFHIIASTPEEEAAIRKGMDDVEARITRDMDPVNAARRMDVDEVVTMAELRPYLTTVVEMAYQTSGYRRVKNPRIWSMHDLKVLTT